MRAGEEQAGHVQPGAAGPEQPLQIRGADGVSLVLHLRKRAGGDDVDAAVGASTGDVSVGEAEVTHPRLSKSFRALP